MNSPLASLLLPTDKANSYLVTLLIMLKLHLFTNYFLCPQLQLLVPFQLKHSPIFVSITIFTFLMIDTRKRSCPDWEDDEQVG